MVCWKLTCWKFYEKSRSNHYHYQKSFWQMICWKLTCWKFYEKSRSKIILANDLLKSKCSCRGQICMVGQLRIADHDGVREAVTWVRLLSPCMYQRSLWPSKKWSKSLWPYRAQFSWLPLTLSIFKKGLDENGKIVKMELTSVRKFMWGNHKMYFLYSITTFLGGLDD